MGKKQKKKIIKIIQKIDKLVQKKKESKILNVLKKLKDIPMTLELLQSTSVLMSVKGLRKQITDKEITSLVKSLTKPWKKLMDEPSGGNKPSEEKKKGTVAQGSSHPREEGSSNTSQAVEMIPTTRISSQIPEMSNLVRYKCREMLSKALQTGDDHITIGVDCDSLGAQIEECIFLEFRNTDMKYKTRVRSRISNLKDVKNPTLRRNVLCSNVSPDHFAKMTAEEMASDELKEMRKNLTKDAIRYHQMANTVGMQSDMFTCGKCKMNKCTYTSLQTRSADESMTTFVFCSECGNRWKFC